MLDFFWQVCGGILVSHLSHIEMKDSSKKSKKFDLVEVYLDFKFPAQ